MNAEGIFPLVAGLVHLIFFKRIGNFYGKFLSRLDKHGRKPDEAINNISAIFIGIVLTTLGLAFIFIDWKNLDSIQ